MATHKKENSLIVACLYLEPLIMMGSMVAYRQTQCWRGSSRVLYQDRQAAGRESLGLAWASETPKPKPKPQ